MRQDIIPLEKKELRELLNKNWMTHDAMWFYNCVDECGAETACKLNLAAIRGMSALEIKRIQKALKFGKIESFDEFKRFFDGAMALATGDFMKYSYSYGDDNTMHAEWYTCFSYEGMKAKGIIDRCEECGVFLRIFSWLDTLGLKYEVQPVVKGCMMHTDGKCYRDVKLFFEK